MGGRRELIVVSNRGPLGYDLDDEGRRVVRRGAGGLVTALRSLVSHHDVTWIASAVTDEERRVAAGGAVEERSADGSPYRLRLVAHDPRAYDLYYNVVANPTLWFVQHGLWELKHAPGAGLDAAWDEGYVPVNAAFAAAVLEELGRIPAATVFFHDYHLYAAPRLVRKARPDALLGHFVHIPWVGPADWAVLPRRIARAIHEGVLASDAVGFHTERWRDAFLASCAELGLDTDGTRVAAHPISVDVDEFERLAQSPKVLERERELVATRPEQLIV
ncbi:MAG TPA: trehalose-6-phosphate synthase, partial [Gaiellaceae bacterium]|nr:trehalose-6-phosphate synthase [Gaiellaceae bacterium]